MAESFKKLLDATYTQSHLNDGEQTILSGGTNKVIKSISVTSPDMDLSNTYLELDGVNIADLNIKKGGSYTIEGHQILAPSSTLKIKTSDWPRVAEQVIGIANDNNKLRYYSYVQAEDGTAIDVNNSTLQFNYETTETTGSLSYAPQCIDLIHLETSAGKHIYYHSHDDNSQQSWYGTRSQEVGGSTNGSMNNQQFTYQNYKGFGIFDHRRTYYEGTNSQNTAVKYEMRSSGQFIGHAMNIYPTAYTVGGIAKPNWGNASTGHPSPHPTSSYPRAHVYHGMYCYIPSSGYSQIYVKNTLNGTFHKFDMNQSIQYGHGDFVMSVDHVNDEWYFYTYTGSNQVTQYKAPFSWTDMRTSSGDASSPSQTRNDHNYSDWADVKTFTFNGLNTDFQAAQFGHTSKGGLRYRTTSGTMITVDRNGDELYQQTSDPKWGNAGHSSHVWRHFGVPILSSVASAAGLDQASLKITITGIEQT